MSKLIEAGKLQNYLWREGPYIYYYNGDKRGFDQHLFHLMNCKAKIYKFITIFHIDFADQIKTYPYALSDIMEYIYLYYEGTLRLKSRTKDEKLIEEIFKMAINFHSKSFAKRGKKIVALSDKIYDIKFSERNLDIMQKVRNIQLLKSKKSHLTRKQYHILKKQEYNISTITKGENLRKISEIPYLKKEIIEKISKNYYKSVVNNPNDKSNKWFHEVEISDIPFDLFEDENLSCSFIKNNNIYNNGINDDFSHEIVISECSPFSLNRNENNDKLINISNKIHSSDSLKNNNSQNSLKSKNFKKKNIELMLQSHNNISQTDLIKIPNTDNFNSKFNTIRKSIDLHLRDHDYYIQQ